MEYDYEMKMYESDEQKKGVSSDNVKISYSPVLILHSDVLTG